ncbi:hypothetical protein CRG98_028428, partial [Punica granatum]
MNLIPFAFLLLWPCSFLHLCNDLVAASASTDTITEGQSLNLSQTITSSNQVFELGLFDTVGTIYLGIWYKVEPKTVVWVANRDQPAADSSTKVTLRQGNLVILGNGFTYAVSKTSTTRKTIAVLLDSGNLVLRDGNATSDILWQSFDYPTDTMVPGMKLGTDKVTGKVWSLTAWENWQDPSRGILSLKLNPQRRDELVLTRGSKKYWSSGSWNGQIFPSLPEMKQNNMYNCSFVSTENMSYFTYSMHNTSIQSRLVINGTTEALQLLQREYEYVWSPLWSIPRDRCDDFTICGPFSSCMSYNRPYCKCFEGFTPLDSTSWGQGDTSRGCVRRTPLNCGQNGSLIIDGDRFLAMPNVVPPTNPVTISTTSSALCKALCLVNCSCYAYGYGDFGGCTWWNNDISNLTQLAGDDPNARRLYLRLAASEIRENQVTCPSKIGKKKVTQDMPLFDVDMMSIAAHLTEHPANGKQKNSNWFPQFTLASTTSATDNFSQQNKLGEGGFGPVYK